MRRLPFRRRHQFQHATARMTAFTRSHEAPQLMQESAHAPCQLADAGDNVARR